MNEPTTQPKNQGGRAAIGSAAGKSKGVHFTPEDLAFLEATGQKGTSAQVREALRLARLVAALGPDDLEYLRTRGCALVVADSRALTQAKTAQAP